MKRPPNQKLTEDDRKRIMRLLMAGLSTEIVAKRFGVSAKTIRMHWSQKLRKNPAKDDGERLTDYANGQRLSRTADELDTVGWIAIALRSAKFLFLVNRDHGLQPSKKSDVSLSFCIAVGFTNGAAGGLCVRAWAVLFIHFKELPMNRGFTLENFQNFLPGTIDHLLKKRKPEEIDQEKDISFCWIRSRRRQVWVSLKFQSRICEQKEG